MTSEILYAEIAVLGMGSMGWGDEDAGCITNKIMNLDKNEDNIQPNQYHNYNKFKQIITQYTLEEDIKN